MYLLTIWRFLERGASEISTRFGHEDALVLLECQLQPSGLAYGHLKHTSLSLVRSLISVNAHCRLLVFVSDEGYTFNGTVFSCSVVKG
jgi:hypothetical protein